MTPEERARLIEDLATLPAQLEQVVTPLTPDQLVATPIPGEWSVAQIVHHLADSHLNAFLRIKLILTEETPTIKPYNQVAWGNTPEAVEADVTPSLDIVRGLHSRWVTLLQSLDDAQWQRRGSHPETDRIYTVEGILQTYSHHGEAHLEQIRTTLAALA